eukprot:TRINITY_DN4816_c0_g1_i1.p1 TRINITY_DN4816_c0_g1~~TRINITY_DN4816_c0_g1_i1.p1  ORF type:complete len:249 (-),score=73.57 TRINITY_DN4816_c0_g1_i1:107-853(-)
MSSATAAFAAETAMVASSHADKERPSKPVWVSPTPSSVCPTESTTPGDTDLQDCDSASEASAIPEECEEECAEHLSAEEALAPTAAEARSWRQISERLRRVFSSADSDEEDDDFDFDYTTQHAFSMQEEDDDFDFDYTTQHAFSMQEEDIAPVVACKSPSKKSSSGAFSSVLGQVEDGSQLPPFYRVANEADNAPADASFSVDAAVGSSQGKNWQMIGKRLGQILRTADPEESAEEEDEAEAEPEPGQ